jgi:hypothetical protein
MQIIVQDFAPMHRHKNNALLYLFRNLRFHPYFTSARSYNGNIALLNLQSGSINRIDLNKRLLNVLVKLVYLTGFAHGMPLIAYAAGGKDERIIVVNNFAGMLIRYGTDLCVALFGYKTAYR